ncbi:glycosyltransferase family 4 protein [Acidobacteriota bacterium]
MYSFNSLIVIGNYLPRKCGIATYTTDVCEALASETGPGGRIESVAMDDVPEGYPYPDRVKFQVRANKQSDYLRAAEYINVCQFDAALLQHEFGIFGGRSGAYILFLIKSLRMPVITTLHSVLIEPTDEQRSIIRGLAEYSDFLIVLSKKARELLTQVYAVPEKQIVHIPHGIPDIPLRDPNSVKPQFGVQGRKVILTFGLMGPGKGIELILKALPAVIEKNPDAVYLILGATHPQIKKVEHDKYRHSLHVMVSQLGIEDHVLFHNQFVSLEVLCQYLSAADVYCTPYPSREQIVSGTLAYAMGAGAAVVSTPYLYAEEMLSDGRGRLVAFNDSEAFAREINALLRDDDKRAAVRQRAYRYCRKMVWKEVARDHAGTVQRSLESRTVAYHPVPAEVTATSRRRLPKIVEELPEPNLRHLRRMTDETGILQHAIYSTPNRREGYCTDDNARALIAVSMYHALSQAEDILPLVHIYLAFLHDAFNAGTGRFRNFMSYDRRWLDDAGSEDSHGRAMWGLGEAVRHAPDEAVRDMATRLFMEGLNASKTFGSPRALAFVLIGLHAYLESYGGDATVRRLRVTLAERIHKSFEKNATEDWPWCEDTLTYSNAKLLQALLLSGQWIPDPTMRETGIRGLRWVLEQQTAPEGHISLFGNEKPFSRDGQRASFDQQPVEMLGLIGACAEAYRSTGEREWLHHAERCLRWFLGDNDIGTALYDYRTGGCCDGLQPHGPNRNQGAESTLAWLISLLTLYDIVHEEVLTDGPSVSQASGEHDG